MAVKLPTEAFNVFILGRTPERGEMKFAYADPPYLGCGARLYGKHHPDAAAWDDPETHFQQDTIDDLFPGTHGMSLAWKERTNPTQEVFL